MARNQEWVSFSFGKKDHDVEFVLVDNRFERGKHYIHYEGDGKVRKDSALSFTWTPAIRITVSEAFPPEEAVRLGRLIAKMLNVDWVREELDPQAEHLQL